MELFWRAREFERRVCAFGLTWHSGRGRFLKHDEIRVYYIHIYHRHHRVDVYEHILLFFRVLWYRSECENARIIKTRVLCALSARQ